MAYISFITVILNIVLDFVFMEYFGIMGIALCTAILQIFRCIVYLVFTIKQKKIIAWK